MVKISEFVRGGSTSALCRWEDFDDIGSIDNTSTHLLPTGNKTFTYNYGESPFFFMGKLTISTGPFSMAMLNYRRVIRLVQESVAWPRARLILDGHWCLWEPWAAWAES